MSGVVLFVDSAPRPSTAPCSSLSKQVCVSNLLFLSTPKLLHQRVQQVVVTALLSTALLPCIFQKAHKMLKLCFPPQMHTASFIIPLPLPSLQLGLMETLIQARGCPTEEEWPAFHDACLSFGTAVRPQSLCQVWMKWRGCVVVPCGL